MANSTNLQIRRLTIANCGNLDKVAGELSAASFNEAAVLGRGKRFYKKQIREERVWVLYDVTRDLIVGAVSLLELSPITYEISGGWVLAEYRGRGHYKILKSHVLKFAGNKNIISTTKVESEHAVKIQSTNVDWNINPVDFEYFKKIDPMGYQNCCCCSKTRNYKICDIRGTSCKLNLRETVKQKNSERSNPRQESLHELFGRRIARIRE